MTLDPEAAYYQGVEDFFVSRRGDPLFLSNADWLLIRRWRKQAIPLRIVLRGIRDALSSHAHSWSRHRKVGSLRYCEAEVEVARERWERALAQGELPEGDVAQRLAGIARALEEGRGLGPGASSVASQAARQLRDAAPGASRPRDVELLLAGAERKLVAALRGETPDHLIADLESGVDATLAPYRERMPAKVFADLRAESLTRQILASHGLPRLSLFDL